MSKKKKAPQHAKKSRLRQRFERRLTKENDTGAWQQEDEAVGRAAAGEFDTMSFDAPEEGGSYGEGSYEGAPSVSDDTMDFDMPEDAIKLKDYAVTRLGDDILIEGEVENVYRNY